MKVSIGIKALNEEGKIAAAIESSLAAVAPYGGEVVLADSGSTDATLAIAAKLPVKVVQLENTAERCCGAGAQLAFQNTTGAYFYLMDGDMVLRPEFLAEAVAYLDDNPDCAGIGGIVLEQNLETYEFQIRAASMQHAAHRQAGEVDRLDQGGLYRRKAVESVGYFSDRNLHAFEEFELRARLTSAGWRLARLPVVAVEHYGHQDQGYDLLWRRFRSKYSWADGEVLRGALFQPHFWTVVRRLRSLRHSTVVMIWWAALVALLVMWDGWASTVALAALLIVPLVVLAIRRGSLRLGLYSLTSWNLRALGCLAGLFRARTPPRRSIATRVIRDAR